MKRQSYTQQPIVAKKSLGQHFLIDPLAIQEIVDIIKKLSHDTNATAALEIGPGTGVITRPLLESGMAIHAVEKDTRAYDLLKSTLGEEFKQNFLIENTDILRHHLKNTQDKKLCVGNLPYYITSDILLWLCKNHTHFPAAVFMVQNEVADRLVASSGTKDYGRLTVRMQLFFRVRKHLIIKNTSFSPIPKVDSAIVSLIPTGFHFASQEEERFFERITALLFSARRKMLRRAFAPFLLEQQQSHPDIGNDFMEFIQAHDIAETVRPDALSIENILRLHTFFWNKLSISDK